MSERCIIVDDEDKPVRPSTKAECEWAETALTRCSTCCDAGHQWSKIGMDGGLAHRAFSVFLFDTAGRLVLQRRSAAKITFPDYWANTCCSHPLWVDDEMEMEGDMGVKRAAQRKLGQELGIPPEEIPLSCFHWVTRVHYRASCDDGKWGEHEIDHVLLALPERDVTLSLNPNEVQDTLAFHEADMNDWLGSAADRGTKVSPWFRVIQCSLLPRWWKAVRLVRARQTRGEAVDVAAALGELRDEEILRVGDTSGFSDPPAADDEDTDSVRGELERLTGDK
jgi:isopentenyl-diphosphate Delta-isomerase